MNWIKVTTIEGWELTIPLDKYDRIISKKDENRIVLHRKDHPYYTLERTIENIKTIKGATGVDI
tara:strand:+ start:207 stop:398 length:192 start_codon:yes stop_codon:yes gene_type:complete